MLMIWVAFLLDAFPLRTVLGTAADTREERVEVVSGSAGVVRVGGIKSKDLHLLRSWTNRNHLNERPA